MPAKKYFTPESLAEAKRASSRKSYHKNRDARVLAMKESRCIKKMKRIESGEIIKPRIRYGTDEERKAGRRGALRRYYFKNKKRELERGKKWRKDDPERSRNLLRSWRARNPGRYKDNSKRYNSENKEKRYGQIKEWQKNRSEESKAKQRAKHRTWSKGNPDKVSYHNSLRRMRHKLHPSANKAKIATMYKQARNLSRSTGIKHCVDHIIPVAKKGWHHEDNLQPMPKPMNESKHNKVFWLAPFPVYKDWRDVPRELWPVELVPKYLALIEQNKGKSIRWDTAA